MQILNFIALSVEEMGMNLKIVILSAQNAKFLIIHKETAGTKISQEIMKPTTLKK